MDWTFAWEPYGTRINLGRTVYGKHCTEGTEFCIATTFTVFDDLNEFLSAL